MKRDITQPAVEDYLYAVLPPRDAVLAEMERQAKERNIPIVGPAVGRLLFQLAKLAGAKKVFELGSAIGYSTLWWARAVGEDGEVTYTDSSEKNAHEARGYLTRAGVEKRVRIETGDALELLSEHAGGLDVVFIDLDKADYPRALRAALPKLRSGGMIVADNVLWSGKVADPASEQEESTRAIVEFNRMLYASEQLFTTIIPLRDGVAVAVKK